MLAMSTSIAAVSAKLHCSGFYRVCDTDWLISEKVMCILTATLANFASVSALTLKNHLSA